MRDELNGQLKKAVARAKEFKKQREEYEKLIEEKKEQRSELNKKAAACYSKVEKLRKKSDLQQSIQEFEGLSARIEELELKQQVEVLSKDKDRKLVARIKELRREFAKMQKELEKDKKLREVLEKAQELKEEADRHHEEVLKYVKISHECQDKMVACFREADRVRAKADEAHRLFLEAIAEADKAHKLYLQYSQDLKDFNHVINGLRRKMREDFGFRARTEARRKARGIYEKFRDGEKLSTEDLMLLQKSEMLLK